jgi:hypothetical protein
VKKATLQKLGLGALALLGGVLLLGAKPARGHGTITAPGVSYTPTMDEWLWFARACYGESDSLEGQTAAGWAMVARFAALRQSAAAWREKTFVQLVRAFSQPVNPIWSANSACTSDGRGCCGNCTAEVLGHRAFVQSRSWAWLQEREPELYFMVMSFAAGVPPRNPVPGMTNFAGGSQRRCDEVTVDGNMFCGDPPLEGTVSVVPRA